METRPVPEALRRAELRYGSYAQLAALGGYVAIPRIMSTIALDPQEQTLEDRVIDDINATETVVPFIAGVGEGGAWWLQTEPVATENVMFTGEELELNSAILGRSAALEYEEIYVLAMELQVGAEYIEYNAYAFYDADENTVEVIDPVALGLHSVPEYLPRHSIVGESKHGTWLGCKANHEQQMPQGEMEHWDWWCWDKASCADEAVGKIFCDVNADGCPRIHGTTVQSGSCKNTAGGGLFCTGPEASSVNSKATTVPAGNCQDNINVELWWGPTSTITWEISVKVGGIGVKFGGQTPSHSVYQVYKLTMCCTGAAPSDPDTDSDSDSESDSYGETDGDTDTDGESDSDSIGDPDPSDPADPE